MEPYSGFLQAFVTDIPSSVLINIADVFENRLLYLTWSCKRVLLFKVEWI